MHAGEVHTLSPIIDFNVKEDAIQAERSLVMQVKQNDYLPRNAIIQKVEDILVFLLIEGMLGYYPDLISISNYNGVCSVVFLVLGEDLSLAIYTTKRALDYEVRYDYDLVERIAYGKTAKVVRSYYLKNAGENGRKLN